MTQQQPQPDGAPAGGPGPGDEPDNGHILLVDDDRLVLATLSASVAMAGYRVSSARSAEDAEELLASGLRPDLVVLDIRMPGQDGLSLAVRLKELDRIPFIMLSAYGDEATVEQAVQRGALGFLVKPLNAAQVVPALKAALARAREMDDLREGRAQLQRALDNERAINVAVGITMLQHRLARQPAIELLRRTARSRRVRLADLAGEILRDCEALDGTAAPAAPVAD